MLSSANEIIKCLFVPYICIGAIATFFLVLSKKRVGIVLSVCILFASFWRIIVGVMSSRYCIALFLYLIVSVCLSFKFVFYKDSTILRSSLSVVLLICLVFNLITSFSRFRNIFYFDINEDLSNMLSFGDTTVFVEEKDYKRITSQEDTRKIKMIPPDANVYLFMERSQSKYSFWTDDANYVFSQKRKNDPNSGDDLNLSHGLASEYKKIRRYFSNKNKTKQFYVYHRDKFLPESYSCFDQVETPFLRELKSNGVLKAYNLEYDTFVFQQNDKLIWVVGTDIDQKDEIIFQLDTTRPDLLPLKRQQYGFDNRGFHINPKNDVKTISRYLVLERPIPVEYPISRVRVGLKKDGKATWFQSFSLSNY